MDGLLGWGVTLGCGLLLTAFLVRGVRSADTGRMGPADYITYGRGLMACVVAGLVASSVGDESLPYAVLGLAIPALAGDAVDGYVARHTGTASAFGGRFDGEVDAFLILVLSVAAAPVVGWWVVAAGLARYVFGAAGLVLPWMRGDLAYRYWRKVVTAVVGVALVVAVADVLPRVATIGVVVVAVALLAESFGRDVWSLWRNRSQVRAAEVGGVGGVGEESGRVPPARALGRRVVVGVAAVALLWFALVLPNQPDRVTAGSLLRLPVEIVILAALALLLPAAARRVVVTGGGLVLAGVALLKLLDIAAFVVLNRPFTVVTDTSLIGSSLAFVRDSFGTWAAWLSAVALVVIVGVAVVGMPWAVGRVTETVARNRRHGIRVVAVLTAAWLVGAATGAQVAAGVPVTVAGTGPYLVGKARASTEALADREEFRGALGADDFSQQGSRDLSALAGKDVLFIFIESYGRVSLEGSEPEKVREVLDSGADRLGGLGFRAASGYLTSPTFGGSSWLAHATLQSGLEVSNQDRYDRLLASDRTTLASAFSDAGWRTVGVLPSIRDQWPEGEDFYGFDAIHGSAGLGYAGPKFGFSDVPDQFALAAFERLEIGVSQRDPVMAQIQLTSSHGPWAPVPTFVDPAELGDGSGFREVHDRAVTAAELWRDREDVPPAYRASIAYSLTSALDFVASRHDDDLVVVMLGDHQPATIITGFGGNRDVPVSVIAKDPAVLDAVSEWAWTDGLRPEAAAPVWPMADFRDRFIAAFSTRSGARGAG
ncbi:sulfatase [Knoellia sinensis KCTC 19936]|uniref:Sulfatase n=1 Tax=Knoellia sinensis KCTC 19936 TaxID=1385520 RepID=A0A0A0J4I4_9MICO|nr:CDP-alcohol phosphatidyltransferase family protein [Knoellia sinensis]KGN31654.1 sulfatase [Knoellia sinensis KCTC 19936]